MILVRVKCRECGKFIDVPLEGALKKSYCCKCSPWDIYKKFKKQLDKEPVFMDTFKEFIDFESGWLKYYKKECREMFE